jgi:hypothetical protein
LKTEACSAARMLPWSVYHAKSTSGSVRAGLNAVSLRRRMNVSPVTPMDLVSHPVQFLAITTVVYLEIRLLQGKRTFTCKTPVASNRHCEVQNATIRNGSM